MRTPTARTANLRTKILDFRGFDSSIDLCLRGGIPRPIGDFPKSLSQTILVGIMLVGRLGVLRVSAAILDILPHLGFQSLNLRKQTRHHISDLHTRAAVTRNRIQYLIIRLVIIVR